MAAILETTWSGASITSANKHESFVVGGGGKAVSSCSCVVPGLIKAMFALVLSARNVDRVLLSRPAGLLNLASLNFRSFF